MIAGKRIVLRAWERSDLETFVRWFNDPEVTQYIGNAFPSLSMDQEIRFYEDGLDNKHRYCIVTKAGVLIGNCSLNRVDAVHRHAEVGIVLGEKDYWGQGYGREALALLQEIAFEGLGLNRIFLLVIDFNERGQRCYRAAGFREEGRLRQDRFVRGRFHDMLIMSVLAEEYWARANAAQ
jgi:RimJ/RimL family protein N-acetyltransferase